MTEAKERLCRRIAEKEKTYSDISRKIWEYAELGFHEYRSAKLLQDTLEAEGFQVETGLAGIPTAFKGTFGTAGDFLWLSGNCSAWQWASWQRLSSSRSRPRSSSQEQPSQCQSSVWVRWNQWRRFRWRRAPGISWQLPQCRASCRTACR